VTAYSLEHLVAWWQAAIGMAESAPPLQLFVAMTVLPLFGVPVSPFWVASGISLGPMYAMLAATASLYLNTAIGYWLARGALRLPLARWMARRGHVVPRVQRATEVRFIVMIRVAPPLPLFVQNYLLGLAGVGFGRYMLLSSPVQMAYALGFIVFGHALTELDLWRIAFGLGLLTSIVLGMGIVRSVLSARVRNDAVAP
jgi:uncharacterized membrane protein YdjX (TVP38/TMEM64 family)